MNFNCLQLLRKLERWKEPNKSLRKHTFAAAGGTDKQQVMSAGSRYYRGSFPDALSYDLTESRLPTRPLL
jgi:hypothetical protein